MADMGPMFDIYEFGTDVFILFISDHFISG